MAAALLSNVQAIRTQQTVLEIVPSVFRERFNQKWFPLQHCLASSPLFSLDRLVELANQTARMRPDDVYFDRGASRPGQRWNETPACELPLDEAIRRIEHEGAWVFLRHAQDDPEYGKLLRTAIGQILELTGPELERNIKFPELIVFITSPGRVTSYHIDRACNFVAQIRGEKTIYLFDPRDREVLPEHEIERFWAVDNNAAIYKPEFQHRADECVLRPGEGLHIPVNAPHWLRNHDNVSITASLNFTFKDELLANVYRANYALRKCGVRPDAPGRFPMRDAFKRKAVSAVMAAADATPNALKDALKQRFR